MKEKVAVATVKGKVYFLIVKKLREQNISFISLVPRESWHAKVTLVMITEQAKRLINHDKIVIFYGEDKLDCLVYYVKLLLLGKSAFQNL